MLQREFLESVIARPDLLERLKGTVSKRVSMVLSRTPADTEFLNDENALRIALYFGTIRALATRYRTAHGLHVSLADRPKEDEQLLQDEAFRAYVVPLDDEEILQYAKTEFVRFLTGRGTDYHDFEAFRFSKHGTKGGGTGRYWVVPHATDPGNSSEAAITARNTDYDVYEALADEDDVEDALYETQDRDPNGRAMVRTMSIAIERFGQHGVAWFLWFWYLRRQESKLLDVLGFSRDAHGATAFERARQSLYRGLPKLHDSLIPHLSSDPLIRDEVRRVSYVENPYPAAEEAHEKYHTEKELRVTALRSALQAYCVMAEHPDLESQVATADSTVVIALAQKLRAFEAHELTEREFHRALTRALKTKSA